jgi:subtilisin family serine protease
VTSPLELVNLPPLMAETGGRPEVVVGLLDGPVDTAHPGLAAASVRGVAGGRPAACARGDSAACRHGTFVAGVLAGARGGAAPGICPGCTLLVVPIFSEPAGAGPAAGRGAAPLPSVAPAALAAALVACVDAGARVVNVSAGFAQPALRAERELTAALDHAARRGVLVVVAAGNQGALGGSALTRHPWVLPVAACDLAGRPLAQTNLGPAVGRRGLSAPGAGVTSLAPGGGALTSGGTSVAAPFVTGALALLWSRFPAAPAAAVKRAAAGGGGAGRRRGVVPPVLDAWAAHGALAAAAGA